MGSGGFCSSSLGVICNGYCHSDIRPQDGGQLTTWVFFADVT
jgi:hypothetical protein